MLKVHIENRTFVQYMLPLEDKYKIIQMDNLNFTAAYKCININNTCIVSLYMYR